MISGSSTPPCLARWRMRIQPDAKQEIGSGKRRAQRSAKADGGPTTIAPAKSRFRAALDGRRPEVAEIDALRLVIFAELRQRAVDVDRLAVAGVADQPDDALRLAERIGADEMRALRELLGRFDELGDLVRVGRMAEDRQAEGRLGDEDVAADRLEGQAGGVGLALVVARGDDARAVMLDADLRRAEHMAGRVEGDGDAVDVDRLAEDRLLRRAGEILAVAQRP